MPKVKPILGLSKYAYERRARTFNSSGAFSDITEGLSGTPENVENNVDGFGERLNYISDDLPLTSDTIFDNTKDSFCSSSSDESEFVDKGAALNFLRTWVHKYHIQKSAVSELLKFLREMGFTDLPADSRTLLHTPKVHNSVSLVPGFYSHIGLKKALDSYMQSSAETFSILSIDLNIDGLNISESSNNTLWPILARITGSNAKSIIFVVGIYHGYSKPKSFIDFLQPLIKDLLSLYESYIFNGVAVKIYVRWIIADAPARNSILCTKSYNGYFGCGRCMQEGLYVENRMTFPDILFVKRTNDNFRNQFQVEHHHNESPFTALDIDMVTQFPLDYLHCVCLGVVKKLLGMWLRGNLRARLQSSDVQKISNRLVLISQTQPSEFQRKCRKLSDFHHFKGAEFRSLILYILPVVTKDILPIDQYEHILLLNCALIILIDEQLCKNKKYLDIAQRLLEEFVTMFSTIYGSEHLVYNVHSLLHIVDDVRLWGSLDNYSAFPFESYMFQLKRMIKKNNQSLAQVCNRVEESYLLPLSTSIVCSQPLFKKKHHSNNCIVFKEVVFKTLVLNCSPRNEWFLTKDGNVFKFDHCKENCLNLVFAKKLVKQQPFYDVPISSLQFNICFSDGKVSDIVSVDIKQILNKVFVLPFNNGFVFSPLRHCI